MYHNSLYLINWSERYDFVAFRSFSGLHVVILRADSFALVSIITLSLSLVLIERESTVVEPLCDAGREVDISNSTVVIIGVEAVVDLIVGAAPFGFFVVTMLVEVTVVVVSSSKIICCGDCRRWFLLKPILDVNDVKLISLKVKGWTVCKIPANKITTKNRCFMLNVAEVKCNFQKSTKRISMKSTRLEVVVINDSSLSFFDFSSLVPQPKL